MTVFKVINFPNGTQSLQDLENLQVMHSAIGPSTEALEVYAQPASAWLTAQSRKTAVVFDIGLGTGSNAVLFLKNLPDETTHVTLHSFETKIEGLAFALQEGFDFLQPFQKPLQELLEKKQTSFIFQKTQIHWHLWEGPVVDYLTATTDKAHLVFFDLYSPRHCPENWTAELFKKIFRQMEPTSLLITYAAAGWVKRNLKTAGFEVSAGPGTRIKRETTHAVVTKRAIQ